MIPDIILLDVNLPGMSGIEALGHLLQTPETAKIPVIGLSATAMQKDIDRGILAGFKLYLTKPFDIEDLINALEENI